MSRNSSLSLFSIVLSACSQMSFNPHMNTHARTYTPLSFSAFVKECVFKGTKQRTCGNAAGLVVGIVMSVRGQMLIPAH